MITILAIIGVTTIVALCALAVIHGGSDGPDPYDGEGW